MDVHDVSVGAEATVRDVIAKIDASGRQIALVIDQGRLLGIVTDGDIRRGILRGIDLGAPATDILNRTPRTAPAGTSYAQLRELMTEHTIRHVPILDAAGTVVDLVTFDEATATRTTDTPVVLMAGGRGQRLYPLTKDVPKPMLPIGGTPLLEIILRNLAAQGFTNVSISVNYLADVIMDYFGDGSKLGLSIRYLHEDKPLGTAGALAQLDGSIDKPFVVMNSDLLTEVNLRRMLAFHGRQSAAATLGVREYVVEIPFGVVNLEGTHVRSMEEKPLRRSLVNAGIYALDPVALSLLAPGEYCDMPTLLGLLMDRGYTVSAFPIHEEWLDVGRPEDLDAARNDAERWEPS